MEVKELKTLVKLVKGKKPKSLSETETKTHSEPYLLAKVIRGSEKPKFGKEDEMVVVSSSDLVIISDGDAGEVFQGLSGGLASTMSKIEPLENINLKYLKYFLISNRKLFSDTRTGAAIPHLNKDVFFNLQIPVPSLQEQEKIVEKLDRSSSLVNQNIEIINKSLEKLTDTREGTINELFNSFENFINWEEAATLVRGPFGGSLTKKMFVNKGYAVYEQRNAIGNNTKEFRYFVNKDKYLELKRFAVMGNDLIMSCSGTIGKVTKIDKDFKEGIINQALLKITPLNSEETDFMIAWMSSKHFKDQLKTKGAAQKNIVSVKEIKKIKYPVPKKNQIDEIIKQVHRIKSISNELNKLYEMKLSLYKKLFLSLLQEDFNHE